MPEKLISIHVHGQGDFILESAANMEAWKLVVSELERFVADCTNHKPEMVSCRLIHQRLSHYHNLININKAKNHE